mgnify:CR=1 FL=1
MSWIILQVIPSLIGYILIVLNFNCATWSLFPEHNFWRWAKLTSIFLLLSFRLEHQAWFRVCVGSVVQWPYASPLLFLDVVAVRLLLREISRQLCRDHHQHFELFQDINWIHEEKYHPCPRWFVLSSTTLLPSVQHKLVRVSCYTLRSMLSSNCSSLPWSITIFYVNNVVRISPPLMHSWYMWYFLPSPIIPWSPCCF